MPAPAKKTMIVNILNILRRYSDETHRLSQKEIVDLLRRDYDMTVERKSIRRNIVSLMECGCEIEYRETVRRFRDPKTGAEEESCIWSDFYLVRDFTDSELRLLIDGLLFSKHVPSDLRRELVEKLEGLTSVYFRSRVGHIRTMPDTQPPNRQLFYTIEVLDEAITCGRKVAFRYLSYGTDKKPHLRLRADGSPKEFVVSPYQIAAANGRYYLICCTEPFDDVAHYRLDRIADVRMTETAARPAKTVRGLENGLDLPRHMAEHLYLFSGESRPVRFRMRKRILNDVIDWFGTDVVFSDESADEITASVCVNLEAMRLWAIQYAPHVTVLSPQPLAAEIRAALCSALERYEKEENA